MRPLDSYVTRGPVLDNDRLPCTLLGPPADYVQDVAAELVAGRTPWPDHELPIRGCNVWDRDNLGTVALFLAGACTDWRGNAMPRIAADLYRKSPDALLWLVEAYLSVTSAGGVITSAEQSLCNGSSVVPDRRQFGYWMKDPAAVAHDWEWTRHFAGDLPDAFGRVPDFHRSNLWYGLVMAAFGHESLALVWEEGLESTLARGHWDRGGLKPVQMFL